LLWGERYGELAPRKTVVYTALSYLVAVILFSALSMLPPTLVSVSAFLLPLASFLLHLYCHRISKDEEDGAADKIIASSSKRQILQELKDLMSLRIMCGLFIVMFIYGGAMTYHSMVVPEGTSRFVLTAVPMLMITLGTLFFGVFLSKNALNLGTWFRFSLLFIAALFIPLSLMDQSFNEISEFFASLGINEIEIITWILLAYLAKSSKLPRFMVFAVSYAVAHGGMAAGELAGLFLLNHVLMFSILSICVLVALAGFFFTDHETIVHFRPPNPSELGLIASKSGLLQHAVELIAADHSLSEREQEVFSLWATGYGAKAIESKLIISASTVKTHIQHIYEKCDVHNRTEIIGLLEKYSVKAEEHFAG
jgi:DNA-binding CsgD family transcriptional regulator